MESARLLLFPISDRICFTSFWFGVGFFFVTSKAPVGAQSISQNANTGQAGKYRTFSRHKIHNPCFMETLEN